MPKKVLTSCRRLWVLNVYNNFMSFKRKLGNIYSLLARNLNGNTSVLYSLHHPWLQEIPVGQEDPCHPFHPVLLEVQSGQSNQGVPKQDLRKYS